MTYQLGTGKSLAFIYSVRPKAKVSRLGKSTTNYHYMALSMWCVSSWKLREKDVGVSLQLCMCDNGESI
jgi:hypothetical protein